MTDEDKTASATIFNTRAQRNYVTVLKQVALVRDVRGRLIDVILGDGRSDSASYMTALAVRWPQFGPQSDLWGVNACHEAQINVTAKEWKRLANLRVDPSDALDRASERESMTDGYRFPTN